jgi:hypothetical protein
MKKIFLFIATTFLLSNCSFQSENEKFNESLTETTKKNASFNENYSVFVPKEIPFLENTELGSFAWTYDQQSVERRKEDYSVAIFDNSNIKCSKEVLGSYDAKEILAPSERMIEGRVDYYAIYSHDYPVNFIEPLCNPAYGHNAAGYAFCAEKNGKTVVICVAQTTDDEAKAKEIFDSFQWND